MEFSNRPEFEDGGPYLIPPGEEQTPPGPEFTPPGLEFHPPEEEFPPDGTYYAAAPPQRDSKRLIAAFLALLGLFGIKLNGELHTTPSASPIPSEDVTLISAASEPNSFTEATAEAIAQPSLCPIHLKVYGGYLTGDGEAVLLDATYSPETISSLAIPQPEPQPGYRFLGYGLVHRDRAESWFSESISESINLEALQVCKPDGNGIIQITLWGTWIADSGADCFLPLTLDANGGEGTQTYDAVSPRLSGTNVYLSPFPIPTRPGWQFTGWYREKNGGEPVLRLQASDFYDTTDGQTDWRRQKPITLYAHWEKYDP